MPQLSRAFRALSTSEWIVSAVVFTVLGVVMNAVGHVCEIAWFKHWWQVFTCYLGYVLPLAVVLRPIPSLRERYAYAILAFIPLELVGYAIGSSVIADGNIIATVVGPHNFTLAMVLLVSPTPLVGNSIVDFLRRLSAPPSSSP